MKEITQIENYAVEIWRRPYQRTIKLGVRADGKLRVTCGLSVPQREISRFVSDSREFIQKRFLQLEANRRRFPAKKYVSGEQFLFFGVERTLEVIWTWQSRVKVSVGESHLEMLAPLTSSEAERGRAFNDFFKRQGRLHLPERLLHFSALMGLSPKQLSVRGQRTRWGSCSAGGEISLNWKLLAAPEAIIDYVVIHELAHLRFMNHSQRFWDLVGQFHPAWRQSRKWLNQHEFAIGVQFPRLQAVK